MFHDRGAHNNLVEVPGESLPRTEGHFITIAEALQRLAHARKVARGAHVILTQQVVIVSSDRTRIIFWVGESLQRPR